MEYSFANYLTRASETYGEGECACRIALNPKLIDRRRDCIVELIDGAMHLFSGETSCFVREPIDPWSLLTAFRLITVPSLPIHTSQLAIKFIPFVSVMFFLHI